jgi:hypothetical protein
MVEGGWAGAVGRGERMGSSAMNDIYFVFDMEFLQEPEERTPSLRDSEDVLYEYV